MHIDDLIDPTDLARGIADKLIAVRESSDGDLIHNYTDAAMYTPGAWDNPAVRQCRGLITDPTGMIIARPWAKFFNHGQPEAGELDLGAPVEVTDKMDGSLGIIHLDTVGGLRVATRGSFESEQAKHATAWLRSSTWSRCIWPSGFTLLAEIIYPDNRIVCDYGDRDELVLLGAVEIKTGRYLGPIEAQELSGWPFAVTEVFAYRTLKEALTAPPRPGAEGLVVRYLDRPHMVKIKQDDYVALHRIVTGLSERTVWEHLMARKPLDELLATLPDELHPWTRDVADQLTGAVEYHAARVERHFAQLAHLADDRPAFAAEAKQAHDLTPWLFQRLDGKDYRTSILKTLKLRGDARAKHITEATA